MATIKEKERYLPHLQLVDKYLIMRQDENRVEEIIDLKDFPNICLKTKEVEEKEVVLRMTLEEYMKCLNHGI